MIQSGIECPQGVSSPFALSALCAPLRPLSSASPGRPFPEHVLPQKDPEGWGRKGLWVEGGVLQFVGGGAPKGSGLSSEARNISIEGKILLTSLKG